MLLKGILCACMWIMVDVFMSCVNDDAVDASGCVGIYSTISLVEQYTFVDKYLIPRRFDPKVFVICKQLTKIFWSKRPAIKYLSCVVSHVYVAQVLSWCSRCRVLSSTGVCG